MPETMEPAVTGVLPVRNGAASLGAAMESLLQQTRPLSRIVISDNASTDGTEGIARGYAEKYSQVRYVRRQTSLTAFRHFREAFGHVETPFFLFAAHDDLRSENYVETLLPPLLEHPSAGLAFGELVQFTDRARAYDEPVVPYRCDSRRRSQIQRLRSMCTSGCVEFYGLWRTTVLDGYPWFDIEVGPDIVLLSYLLGASEVVQVSGTRFYQWVPERPKTPSVRALETSYATPRRRWILRLSWLMALAAAIGSKRKGERRSPWLGFAAVYVTLKYLRVKTVLFEASPPSMQNLYRRLKYRRRMPNPHSSGDTAAQLEP